MVGHLALLNILFSLQLQLLFVFQIGLKNCRKTLDQMSNMQQNQIAAASDLPKNKLLDIVNSRYLAMAICIANKKKLAYVITPEKPVSVEEIAKSLYCSENMLYRFLSYLAAYGIFEEKDNRSFQGNDISQAMREDIPNNCHHMLLAHGSRPQWKATIHMDLLLDVPEPPTPFESVTGLSFYDYLAANPDDQKNFDFGIKNATVSWQQSVPDYYDFSPYSSIVDLAGGCGGLLKAILEKNPKVTGTLFEAPSVLKNVIPELFSNERFRAVPGDFCKDIDVAADIYTVAVTLHCFNDSRLSVILANIAKAMKFKSGSKLLILEVDYEKTIVPNTPSGQRTV